MNLASKSPLYHFIDSWFPPYAVPRIHSLAKCLPTHINNRLIQLIKNDHGFSFESITNERIAFTTLRVLSRIFLTGNKAIIIRGEIELTHRCNFNCAYCFTRLNTTSKEDSLTRSDVLSLMHQYADAGCKYIHFNGGEISLLEYVPDLVAEAVGCGMRVGISSNGSGDLAFYRALAKAGLSYAHISFDIANRTKFDCNTSCQSWDRVNENLHFLCGEAKSVNNSLSIVANIVLLPDTIRQLPNTIRHLLKLGIDEIKLMPIVDKEEDLNRLANLYSTTIKPEIEQTLANRPGFDILRMRLDRLFKNKIHGVDTNSKIASKLQACEICTEQVMVRRDGTYAPCFINMRHNYKAADYGMGQIDIGIEEYVQMATQALSNKYLDDKICLLHCPDMIYNANYQVQNIVSSCLASVMEANPRSQGQVAGDLHFSYKEIESSFLPKQNHGGLNEMIYIPHFYLEEMATLIGDPAGQERAQPARIDLDLSKDDIDTYCVMQHKLSKLFMAKSNEQLIAFKANGLGKSEIANIERKAYEKIKPVSFRAHLLSGNEVAASGYFEVPPVIF